MSYCVNCGVELEASLKECPLCNTPVINPKQPHPVTGSGPYPSSKGQVEVVKRFGHSSVDCPFRYEHHLLFAESFCIQRQSLVLSRHRYLSLPLFLCLSGCHLHENARIRRASGRRRRSRPVPVPDYLSDHYRNRQMVLAARTANRRHRDGINRNFHFSGTQTTLFRADRFSLFFHRGSRFMRCAGTAD